MVAKSRPLSFRRTIAVVFVVVRFVWCPPLAGAPLLSSSLPSREQMLAPALTTHFVF